eukprot:2949936-Amphidinium_carterae.1
MVSQRHKVLLGAQSLSCSPLCKGHIQSLRACTKQANRQSSGSFGSNITPSRKEELILATGSVRTLRVHFRNE